MNACEDGRSAFPLRVLLFRVGGIGYGVSADQVLSTDALCAQDADGALLWFHRAAGHLADPQYDLPVVVTLRSGRGKEVRMVINALEDLVEVAPDDIRPMPALMERYALGKGMWGVLLRAERLYLLVDFDPLTQQKSKQTRHGGQPVKE